MKQAELNLNWVCDTTNALLNSVEVSICGRELIAIVGHGTETDNWEATCAFLSSLNVNEESEFRAIKRQFIDRIERCMRLMRSKNLSLAAPAPGMPPIPVPATAQENLAHAICYLAFQQISRWRKARTQLTANYQWYQSDIPQEDFQWDYAQSVKRCLWHIERAQPHYYYFPGELVPLLANRLYQREVAGIDRGASR